MVLPILLNIVFIAGCAYFAVKTPSKLHVVGVVAVGFLFVMAAELVSLAILSKYFSPTSKSANFLVPVYMAILEEIARLAIILVLFRTLADKGISSKTLIFAGISFGLCEYVFRVVGWSVGQTDTACGTGLSLLICQNTIALAPFAMHIVASVMYSIVLGVRAAFRLPAFVYAFILSIILHSSHNIGYVTTAASGGDVAVYDLAITQLRGLLAGAVLALLGIWIYREYLRRHNDNNISNRPNGQ